MPGRSQTFNPLIDNALQLNITKLKAWGYIKAGESFSTKLSWSIRGNPRGDIDAIIRIDDSGNSGVINLKYCYKGIHDRDYCINLVSKPSNLGIGHLWYFVCPETGRNCRKLYSIGGYFLSRSAHKDTLYETQTESKKTRLYKKILQPDFDADEAQKQLRKPYLKKTYRGKPTKTYLRLIRIIDRAEERWALRYLLK